ncbi:transporter substrate-binding domain-containing protein [Inhella gelatinilytica]|uniref:Transporter substrate-binding domain-containing protein n=1 Tax=Inhella gelatinilytica TaxID=2795030 RepID=A0A931NEI3_9BURK|nr:transporter substrate-binding domain-containing protein [Inhella gelatinilytica]MBH9552546.1 transporter substrate-binding domain-containing protein [Inhella gelatinilytica]
MRVFALWIGLLMLACGSSQAQPLRLAANERLAEQWVAATMLRAIYAKAGLQAKVEPLPPARANLETLSGQRDGEVARIAAYGDRNPSLVRVETPYYQLTSQAFWLRVRAASIKDRKDLVHYSVGAIRGVAHSSELTLEHPSVTLTNEPLQMFRMLLGSRFDVALDTGINGKYLIAKNGWQDIESSTDLAKLDLYHYLHPKHAKLAPRLNQIIRQMRESGELDHIRQQAEAELLKTQLDQFSGK